MLKVNVGLSRKLTKNYDSTGFSVNLEGEILADLNDPEGIVARVQELYDLAEESLHQQVERHESDSAIASRDEAPPNRPARNSSRPNGGSGRTNGNGHRNRTHRNGNGDSRNQNEGDFTQATNKQISFMTNLAKRQGLTTPQLRQRVTEIVGREADLYDLSKQEAGIVLDELTAESDASPSRRR